MVKKSPAPLIVLLGLLEATVCLALPQGKAWVPTVPIELPGFVYLGPPRFDWNGKMLYLQTMPRRDFGGDARGFLWSDSTWVETWRLGYPTLIFWPVISPNIAETYLVWGGASASTAGTYQLAQLLGNELSPPDTIARVAVGRTEYAAAVAERRRWFVVHDRIPNPGGVGSTDALRIFYSDTAKAWREAPIAGSAGFGVTIAPLDDTTAVVVWASSRYPEKLQWGLLRGREWIPRGLLSDEGFPIRPRFRRRPGGGYWLSWGTEGPDVMLSSFVGGVWSPPLRITADYVVEPHNQHFAEDTDMSRDEAEYPVVAWDTQSPFSGGEIAVSFPLAGGYSLGEVVPGSGVGVLPSVARDLNGDTWIAWWREFGPTRWTHTYTRATAADIRLKSGRKGRTVTWTLSEPAPGSWWTVLRSRGDGPFEEAAQVQAGEGLDVSWTDDSRTRGGRGDALVADDETDHGRGRAHVRYKVRRDCLDTRYQWQSEEVSWPPRVANDPPRHQPRLKPPLRPWRGDALLEVADAAPGAVQVALYDLQGREVMSERVERSGEGGLQFPLDRAREPLRAGVYFARVRDASGAWSGAVRAVVLR